MNVCVIQEDEGRIFIVSELTDHDALEMLAVNSMALATARSFGFIVNLLTLPQIESGC